MFSQQQTVSVRISGIITFQKEVQEDPKRLESEQPSCGIIRRRWEEQPLRNVWPKLEAILIEKTSLWHVEHKYWNWTELTQSKLENAFRSFQTAINKWHIIDCKQAVGQNDS